MNARGCRFSAGLIVCCLTFVTSASVDLFSQDDAASAGCPSNPLINNVPQEPVCVTTYHNQNTRKGINSHETILTKTAITNAMMATTYGVDGQVYGQPLFLPAVSIAGGTHNVVYVATETNKVYALDGNTGAQLVTPLDLLQQLSQTQITTVLGGDIPCNNIYPNVGITGTPVINITASTANTITGATIFLVSRGKDGAGVFHQTLWALRQDLSIISHEDISAQITTTDAGLVNFDPKWQNQRGALLYQSGYVYVPWGSHCDNNGAHAKSASWHGWVMAFKLQNGALQSPISWLASEYPEAGIWQGGGGLAGDGANVYFATGNGSTALAPNANTSPCTGCYGNSVVSLAGPSGGAYTVKGAFTPYDHPVRYCPSNDYDLGSSGVILVPSSGFSHSNLLLESGKEGTVYLLDYGTASAWGYGGPTGPFNCPLTSVIGNDNTAVLTISGTATGGLCFDPTQECGMQGTPVFWNNGFYFGSRCQGVSRFALGGNSSSTTLTYSATTSQGGVITSSCGGQSVPVYRYPGATLSVSQSSGSAAVLWAVDNSTYATSGQAAAPAILWAYDASSLANISLSSTSQASITLGNAVKFAVPTVVNGYVYAGGDGALTIAKLR